MQRLGDLSVASTPSRAQSMASTSMLLAEDGGYEDVDLGKLYECILKILIIEYRNEPRFRTPIKPKTLSPSSTNSTTNSHSHSSSFLGSKDDDSAISLPSYLVPSLEKRLNQIAMKKIDTHLDEMTRRSMLRLYSELLDPNFKNDLKRINKPEILVMKFVACADKEVAKMGTVPANEISETVFKQAGMFVQILIKLLQNDPKGDQVSRKLKEYKESLKPKSSAAAASNVLGSVLSMATDASSSSNDEGLTYPQPSFRVSDMDLSMIAKLTSLFNVDSIMIQQDVFKLKDLAQEKTLQKDIQQVQFYLNKDLGQMNEKSFLQREYYDSWKLREGTFCSQLLTKYQVPASMRLISIPTLPPGEDFYILPPANLVRAYFVVLLKKCIEDEKEMISSIDIANPDERLFSKHTMSLVSLCLRFWRVDFPTRASSLYTAAHLTGILKDSLLSRSEEDPTSLGPIDISKTTAVFHFCKRIIEDLGKLDWEEKYTWSFKDQDIWSRNLTWSYNEVLLSIKDNLGLIFNKNVKPKFGPYLMFLGDYLESDSLFSKVEETGIIKKWEKRLFKVLLRASESRYAELLANLPRDDTLSIIHILDISDNIVADIKALQKRYKAPLLGFLAVSKTSAAVITGMFASDSKNILKHINAYTLQRKERLPYGDAMEAYKSLHEIRDIFNQVNQISDRTQSGKTFKFDLESFFFPFLEDWVNESGDRIRSIINESIALDEFKPIDIDDDSKKYSSSVLDIFTLIKQYLKILKNLNWSNEYQLVKVYTRLLQSISEGVLTYANRISEKVLKELDEEDKNNQKSTGLEVPQNGEEKRKSGNVGGWFDEVKNVVSNIQSNGSKLVQEEPYNFMPETCIALNNLSAMMDQLNKLEEYLDPESISNIMLQYDPTINKKFTSHVFSVRIVKAENIKSSSGASSSLNPYITLIDTNQRKTIARTRIISNTDCPEWDEEFEITLPANSSLTISSTLWDASKYGTHSMCGRSLLQLQPRNFKHDGLPQEIFLDLDTQGRVLIEVAVESERADAMFVMGRAHRALQRCQDRCIKLIVQKFSRFIHLCFSRSNLKSICGNSGNLKPNQDQMDQAMMPLYDYLNSNLQTLAIFLNQDLLMKVMIAAWGVVISSADELLLPKLTSAKTFNSSSFGSSVSLQGLRDGSGNWQSAVSNAMQSIGISGYGKLLTNLELETVFSWLNFLCYDFFHNGGNGPPVSELKNAHYQALLHLPVYYDRDVEFLTQEVERISPAFEKSLRDRNNIGISGGLLRRSLSRTGSIVRSNTISANATAKARKKAYEEARDAVSDPIFAQTAAEDIILRLLLIKEEKLFVAKRLEQRERLAHSIATERMARAAAEGIPGR